jgi:ring-1,2-phenylacetyl-CoA epoxidase subunit PaaD
VVTTTSAREAVARVVDPEIRVLTLEDLGVIRDVTEAGGRVTVTITPTYSGCPAMEVMRADIRRTLAAAGYAEVDVRTVLRPAWTTDMISEAGKRKLAAAGIAPPGPSRSGPVGLSLSVRCPRCGEPDTEQISRFGSTACKALWRCRACGEPFDHIKPL